MSIAPSPPRPRHNSRLTAPDFAAIGRARHIVGRSAAASRSSSASTRSRRGGGRALGACRDALRQPNPGGTLRCARTACSSGREFCTIDDAGRSDREAARHPFSTKAATLRYDEGAWRPGFWLSPKLVADRYGGRLAAVGEQVADRRELERALGDSARLGSDDRAGVPPRAARRVAGCRPAARQHTPRLQPGTSSCRLEADALDRSRRPRDLDFRDLEAGARATGALLTISRRCPGGEECPFAAFAREQFVHF